MKFNIKNTFISHLPADPVLENRKRQVSGACFSFVMPKPTSNPQLLHVSPEMLEAIGLTQHDAQSEEFLKIMTGNTVLEHTKPFAMNYAGHQFGNWAGQLGDGRAINLFEVAHNGMQWMLQLKGAGPTPYSRSGDGLAVLRSSVREYLCSEAMHHLGIPTTRALALALTGDKVLRDISYDGHPAYEKGAIVSRMSPSFLRFGSFEIFMAYQDHKNLKTLADFCINHYYPFLGAPSKASYIAFFAEVAKRTLEMIIHWQRVGFVHGVMNTDNMSVLGLTIDYGPYGWLEGFDFGWTPNTTDSEHKRYRYGNQPNIGLWNLYQFANALYPLIEDPKPLEAILEKYTVDFETASIDMMRAKLGLQIAHNNDEALVHDLENRLQLTETDMTIFFRNLSDFQWEKPADGLAMVSDAFYKPDRVSDFIKSQWQIWFKAYAQRLQLETISNAQRKELMNQVNPKYVLRNYMAQLAIDKADAGDYSLVDSLFQLLRKPYAEQPENQKWFAKRPEWARHKIGCSMLSCSS